MELLLIAIVSFVASLMTFFSGFGLGTILLPVFAIFFPVSMAIAITSIVHFFNNGFKLMLVGRYAKFDVVVHFGVSAVLGAFFGAWLMEVLVDQQPIYSYNLFGEKFDILWIKVVVALVIFIFTLLEILPRYQNLQFDSKYLPLGGALSGFFGGLSGHQGALRSAFLLRLKLSKEQFIATGVVIACLVDVARFCVYFQNRDIDLLKTQGPILLIAVLSAFVGAFIGNQFLKKMTLDFFKNIVALAMIVFALAMGLGLV